jgi:hypothetical protein
MAVADFAHFDELLGIDSDRDCTLDLQHLIEPADQGDPPSPQLFVLAVDTLGRIFRCTTELNVLQQLHPCRAIPAISLYAHGVILFCHPSPEDVLAVQEILQFFGRALG